MFEEMRLSLRGLMRSPGFLGVALVTLGVAIGANVSVFTLANAVMIRPLPFGDRSDRVVSVRAAHVSAAEDWGDAGISYADLTELRSWGILEAVGGYISRNFTLQDGVAARVAGGSVTPDLFPLLGVEPALGRQFRSDEGAPPGFESVVILSHGLWQRRYGGRTDIVGRAVHVNGRALTVVGVMPQGFAFPERDELYLPLRWDDAPRSQRSVAAFGLLRLDRTLEQTQRELDTLAAQLARTFPATHDGWTLRALTFRDLMVDAGGRRLTVLLLASVGLVLLIGCANLASLFLARGETRRRELAVRVALGASRGALVRAAFVESFAVAVPGTALGVLVAAWALDLIPLAFADGLPYWVDLRPDVRVAAFTAAVTVLTALMLGLAPAIRFSRPDTHEVLKASAFGSTGTPGVQRMRALLVMAQIAMSVGLVTAATLMVRSAIALQRADGGFDEGSLLTFRTYLPGDGFDAVAARAAALSDLTSEVRRIPGVTAAALTTSIPTDDGGVPIRLAGPGGDMDPRRVLGARQVGVSPELFDTLGLQVEGRTFTPDEFANPTSDVVIVSRALANRLWSGASPLDRRLPILDGNRVSPLRVVGVVPDVVYEEFGEETEQSRLVAYVPYARAGWRTMAVMVRTAGPPEPAIAAVRRVLRERFAGFATYDLRTMEQVRTYTTWEQRVFSDVMAAFAMVAVALAWIGVYGLVAYSVARRTREIGVRMALGASRSAVLRMMLRESAVLAAGGLVAGIAVAAAAGRLLRGLLYGVDPGDPQLLALAVLVMLTAVGLAAWWPARRAARIQPMQALRVE